MGKTHQKLGAYCVWKSHSFARQPQWLPGIFSISRGLTGELKSLLSQQHMHSSLRGTAVCWPSLPLQHYDSWQPWPLWLLNLRAPWRQWPVSHKSLDTGWIKPQFHSDFNSDEGDLQQSYMALEIICWMTDVSLWGPASSFHSSRPMESSTLFLGVFKCSEQQSMQPGFRLPVGSSSIQMPCFDPRHFTTTCLHLAASQIYGTNLFVGGSKTDF